mmetsp:Transcript_9723/g.20551  ORF Transcript_9723/g.20551 Transcript_9723/m.20551 type:complete len:84 (-) Transcript_9723:96-347(-)
MRLPTARSAARTDRPTARPTDPKTTGVAPHSCFSLSQKTYHDAFQELDIRRRRNIGRRGGEAEIGKKKRSRHSIAKVSVMLVR